MHKLRFLNRLPFKVIAASVLTFLPFFFAAGQADNSKAAPSAADANLLPDGPGKDLVMKKCTSCHNVRNVISHHGNADDWAQEVAKMIGRGATISDDDANTIVDYLSDHYGPSSQPSDSSASAPDSKPQSTAPDHPAQKEEHSSPH